MCSWPELWLRWAQFGVMSPVFRTHCNDGCSCQPWDFMVDATYEVAITAAYRLREQLMPYIYTAAYEAFTSGVTINHPLYYDWPDHDEAYNENQSYFFGSSVLVAPIVSCAFL
jgi:alpha-glucosidase (family GH31 glycosyl hydrolase)